MSRVVVIARTFEGSGPPLPIRRSLVVLGHTGRPLASLLRYRAIPRVVAVASDARILWLGGGNRVAVCHPGAGALCPHFRCCTSRGRSSERGRRRCVGGSGGACQARSRRPPRWLRGQDVVGAGDASASIACCLRRGATVDGVGPDVGRRHRCPAVSPEGAQRTAPCRAERLNEPTPKSARIKPRPPTCSDVPRPGPVKATGLKDALPESWLGVRPDYGTSKWPLRV